MTKPNRSEKVYGGAKKEDDRRGEENTPNWINTGERCPKCGDRMIENHKYEECSALRCSYIKRYK